MQVGNAAYYSLCRLWFVGLSIAIAVGFGLSYDRG